MAKRDIEFLYEVGGLRKVPRSWQQVLTHRVANISEHIFRMTFIAWTIAIEEKADVEKVIKMCLTHDVAESRATDIAFMHRQYVTRNEELAFEHIFAETTIGGEVHGLVGEYEERLSLEAKIVKDADNLDVDLELREHARLGDPVALDMQKNHRPTIIKEKLYTETAKRMWHEIQESNPDSWHQGLTENWIKNKDAAR
jgi:putative hydrolases of HD superfamily